MFTLFTFIGKLAEELIALHQPKCPHCGTLGFTVEYTLRGHPFNTCCGVVAVKNLNEHLSELEELAQYDRTYEDALAERLDTPEPYMTKEMYEELDRLDYGPGPISWVDRAKANDLPSKDMTFGNS